MARLSNPFAGFWAGLTGRERTLILTLIMTIGLCFVVEIFLSKPSVSGIVSGFAPTWLHDEELFVAIGILDETMGRAVNIGDGEQPMVWGVTGELSTRFHHPIPLGVDLTDTAFWQEGLAEIENMIDQLEALVKETA